MTTAQEEILNRMTEMIREHFEAGVLVVQGEGSEEKKGHIELTYHGGYATAHGLLNVGQWRLICDNELRDNSGES